MAHFSTGPAFYIYRNTTWSHPLITLIAVTSVKTFFSKSHPITQFGILWQEFHILYSVPPPRKLTKTQSHLPRSPKWAASMWLGCFLSVAVLLLEKESMLAEMALIATWLGPAASSKAWFLVLFCGECTDIEAIIFQKIVKN